MSTPAQQPDSPTTDPGTQPEQSAEPQAPSAPPATEPNPAEPPVEPKAKAPKFEGDFDPAKFEKLVENLRGDVAAEKAKREAAEKKAREDQAAFAKKVAAAFGLETDETKPPTIEELTQQLEASRGETKASRDETRQMRTELAVYKAASKFGGDPNLLLDSRAFEAVVKKLDPAADDFATQVGAAITAAVEANPKLAAKAPEPKAPAPTPAGGAPMDPAGGGKRQLTAADVARMKPSDITKAVAEGRLNTYLGG